MNILLINLTRFGDLLQCQAAISGLVRQGHAPALVCLDNFAPAASLLRGLAGIYPLAGSTLLSLLDQGWPGAVSALEAWKYDLRGSFPFDRVCNLTPVLSARLLGRYLAEEGELTGFGLDNMGFGDTADPWAAFLQGASRMRGVSPFNVVDLFRKVAGSGDMLPDAALSLPPEDMVRSVAASLAGSAPQGCTGFVALQLGASEERRRWPAESFVATGDALWRQVGLCPVLVGSAAERSLAGEYRKNASAPYIDKVGETSLSDLAAILAASRMLITNDTGTMHLAAGMGTPVLALFFATAQPWDTGPYQVASCSLEPDLPCHPCAFGAECREGHLCLRSVRPETVSALALNFLRGGTWEGAEDLGGARVWEARLDQGEFIDLRSLSGHEDAERTLWLREQRRVYRQFLDRDRALPFRPIKRSAPLPLPPETVQTLEQSLAQVELLLDALIRQGALLQENPLPQVRQRFLSTWQRVAGLLHGSPYLAALSLLWQEETQGSDDLAVMLRLAKQYLELFRCLRSGLPQQ